MTRHALLISSQTFGLNGCDNDVALIAESLAPWRFEVETVKGGRAVRDGIIDGWRHLIAVAEPEDAVLIYYSGHGALAHNLDAVRPENAYFQSLVPVDMAESRPGDFRGILSLELSRLLAELTARTSNVTVIMDCCHSAKMCRGSGFVPRALPNTWHEGVADHIASIQNRRVPDLRHYEANPHAVRISAAGFHQCAYEYQSKTYGSVGVMTEMLAEMLWEAAGQSVSWSMLGKCVREKVLFLNEAQRPEVDGPANRYLFSTKEADRSGVLTFYYEAHDGFFNKAPALRGGRLAGVCSGDVYGVMPLGCEAYDAGKSLASLIVTEVRGGCSMVNVEGSRLEPGLPAFPVQINTNRLPVSLDDNLPEVFKLQVIECPHLRLAHEGEKAPVGVELRDNEYVILDETGADVTWPTCFDRMALQNLVRIARAHLLDALESGQGPFALKSDYQMEWGRVVAGSPRPMSFADSRVDVGSRLYFRFKNTGDKTLYFNVLNVGVSRRITILNRSQISGIELRSGESYNLGRRSYSGWVGLNISWPESVPPLGPRREVFFVIVSDHPQDLSTLEGRGVDRGADGTRSPLRQFIEQVQHGGKRDVGYWDEDGGVDVRFQVRRVSFLLDPKPSNALDLSLVREWRTGEMAG